MSFNKKAHFADNIEALKFAFDINNSKRSPTEEEIEALKKYSGFGGLKAILNPIDSPDSWPNSDKELFPHVQELVNVIKENVPEKEFSNYYNSLKNSVLTSFYTPPEIVDTIAKSFKDNNITTKDFLDPSAGTGQFLASFKRHNNYNLEATAFEKDLLTGVILKSIYADDKTKVRVEPYEEAGTRLNGSFDFISSNIPFGDVNAWDPYFVNSKDKIKQQSCRAIHNYYFVKSVDLAKEGGIVAFITTASFMNSPSHEPIRNYLVKNCNLISAVRLPTNTFTETAGTSADSDLIILQKNSFKSSLSPKKNSL